MSARPQSAAPLARLADAQRALPGGAAWTEWRAAALARLLAAGLPTPRDDAWKYTSLRTLERRELAPAAARPLSTGLLAGLPAMTGPRLVFVDGRYQPMLSDARLPAGLTLTTFAERFRTESPAALGPQLAGDGDSVEDRIRLLNACLAGDGASLAVAPGAQPTDPLHLIHVGSGGGSYPRTRIEVGAGAALLLIEYHATIGDADSVVASVVDVELGHGARLEHSSLQVAGLRSVLLDDATVTLAADARYQHRLVALGGQLARLDLKVALAGADANVDLAGLFMADGTRELHLRTRVDHREPHGTSAQLYRGVAGGRGRGSYDGKVVVHAGAVKSDSRQSSRNLLLGREASIDTRPQLEINADDVKCSHGATTGALDQNMLFYLLSRGLERATAEALLTYAFAGDVITRLAPEALRRTVEERVLGRLPAAALIREFVA